MPVIELTVVPPSLIESFAMCECASMMPGEMNLPVDVDDFGAGRDLVFGPPTAAILPSRMTTTPFWMVPFVTVHDRAAAERDDPGCCAVGPADRCRREQQCRRDHERRRGIKRRLTTTSWEVWKVY